MTTGIRIYDVFGNIILDGNNRTLKPIYTMMGNIIRNSNYYTLINTPQEIVPYISKIRVSLDVPESENNSSGIVIDINEDQIKMVFYSLTVQIGYFDSFFDPKGIYQLSFFTWG